ncbi:sarcosine oxidase subunit delta [Mesorhizobium sp. C420B]|uniref:sarcosine oxidase subunit delta n=1 Tax=unclassified Mesorhizobium TaxID=325217 RepID=UPI0004CECAE7|nr:sarcosine oxidase subunit delta [Mesorhizobium sp. LSHC420B00]
MRIACPYCGLRDVQEFAYAGDSCPQRPDGPDATEGVMFEYVYLRDNSHGIHEEFWYHAAACNAWLVVRRNTLTHAIDSVFPVKDRKAGTES